MKQENIYVYLEGHDFKHETRLLLKALYPNGQIIFIQEKALVDNQSLLIENVLLKESTGQFLTRVSRDGHLLNESVADISNIDIKVDDEKRILKLAMKQSLVDCISEVNKTRLPWGVLTGIRPTKIVHELLDKKLSGDEILDILTGEYRLSIEKANLITDIAIKERAFIYPLDDDKYSIYISIPFCPTRCLYCSFPSNDINEARKLVDTYTERLIFELIEMSHIMVGKTLDTVYIGGGTPTAIPLRNLDKIIKAVYEYYGKNMREFTVEAGRPDTIDLEMLTMLRENDIKRISINPQTMNDDTLKTIGRNHSVADIVDSFNMAKALGFETINMDLILGLPGESEEDVERTMDYIKSLNPENLTVHTMSLKTKSDLKKDIENYNLTNQNKIENMLSMTKKYAKDMDMESYYMYRQQQILGNFENVGYAKQGHECIYNMLIMEEKQTIIALGAGATSKVCSSQTGQVKRVPNIKDLREYINRTQEMVEKKRSEIYANTGTKRN